jgi:CMP-N-acetylneuraminic acid synthetase/spore coat polysaccharide biosynthesis predicted glycosyltransferase SpsG
MPVVSGRSLGQHGTALAFIRDRAPAAIPVMKTEATQVSSETQQTEKSGPAVLIVIPARGGSKGIPRKNLRALGGRPLLAWAVGRALDSRHDVDVVVSSDSEEILALAGKLGARAHRRRRALASDTSTLDEVVVGSYPEIVEITGRRYDVIVTLQPTCPLLTTASLDAAIDRLWSDPRLDTILSAANDTHLSWAKRDGRFVPLFAARVNRQQLEPVYRETGGLILCRESVLACGSRVGQNVSLFLLAGAEAVDIDTPEDWALCEWYLARRDILFVLAGYPDIGLGHVYNALTIADELVRHRIRFLVTRPSELAQEVLSAHHLEVHRQTSDDLTAEILALEPEVVINDRLDTSGDEIRRLTAAGKTVVNFEDLGEGAREAGLVVNAIYPEREPLPNHYFGPRYFCVRNEFLLTEARPVAESVRNVLVTFGGVDPNNLTRRVVSAIHEECRHRRISINVVAGRGYTALDSLRPYDGVVVDRAVSAMADRIRAADLAFTSAGRTIFEMAVLGTPAIVLAQNDRELTHFFASREHGFRHLGLGCLADEKVILEAFVELLDDPEERRRMSRRMLDNELRTGTARVVRLIEAAIGETCDSRS